MSPAVTPCQGQMGEVGLTAAEAPSWLRTTLYDVMTALQTVMDRDEDDLVVAIMVHWLRSGRITLPVIPAAPYMKSAGCLPLA
jgi:hypothetical protein